MNTRPTGKGEQGFTIVEALVAFTILAVLGVALFQSLGTSAAMSRQGARRENALMLARSLLESVGLREVAALGRFEGEAKGRLRWRRQVTLAEPVPEGARVELRRIEIDVLAPAPDDSVLASVVTIRLYASSWQEP
ncbi:hypothetical protein D3874_27410 [Oleomonas cavernae]|uniref:Prepilin-type N-terminal cleavage/methylation domain-containing protein n=1 Tax=Oleomonas cavernae TaxID=2320859 RepID=A0A418VUH4_9PROT|nr:prepilin-type N-terminal cleavage/methylation domain-containing protein [Oleomonas cavernae]RJF80812.1 hypothetical protein D3874_27410 [Oleomonas cavernae]